MKSILEPFINLFGEKIWAPAEFKRIGPFINENETVLDIGAGGGWTGQLISESKGAKVTLLDVKDFNHSSLPVTIYDGEKIPFEDNTFDVSLLLFVLHHCKDPEAVLKEAMRVSKRVIILEDTFYTWFGRLIVCTNDVLTNLPSFLMSKGGMSLPFQFRKTKEWTTLFNELNTELAYIEQKQLFGLSPQKTLFILENRQVA